MNKLIALEFLTQYQPLPPDQELSVEILDIYDNVREYFLANPDPVCIPLFLNSFGNGSGFGVYQLVEDVICQFSKEEVLSSLISALQSQHSGVKYWCTQIAGSFPDVKLIDPLRNLLQDGSSDIRVMSVYALSAINNEQSLGILKKHMEVVTDENILILIKEVLS
jgi:hypothetical protein